MVTLDLPPLRERGDDVLLLAEHFLADFCRKAHRKPLKFSAAARSGCEAHSWPGNVRELRNLMERLAYLSTGDRIEAEDLAFILSPGGESPALVAIDLPLAEATDRVSDRVHQAAHRTGQGQHERSRQAPGPAPLESVSQDAAAGHAHRRRMTRRLPRGRGLPTAVDRRDIRRRVGARPLRGASKNRPSPLPNSRHDGTMNR